MLKKFLYVIWFFIFAAMIFFDMKSGAFSGFLNAAELRAFDIRQNLIVKSGIREHNKDIVILAIDDASYEYVMDNYGEWPLRRDVYAKVVDYIEAQNPKSIVFDLMFVKSMKSEPAHDKALVNIFKKYDNVYTAMNLDNQPEDLRAPVELPDSLSVPGFKGVDEPAEFSNCRVILSEILDATSRIGMINVSRSEDGVLRKMPVYLEYRGRFYPQLGYIVGRDYLEKYSQNDAGRNIPYDRDGSVILNWYGPAGTFENIPLYKIINAAYGKDKSDYNFEGKVVYVGATAASLFDIKTVPVDRVYPGVEVQATYVNNIIDGSLISRCPLWVNVIAALLLALITVFCVVKISSIFLASGVWITVCVFYAALTYGLMTGIFNRYWLLNTVSPILFSVLVFIVTVLVKYLIMSKDFDRQYKLATTDGLTGLYNHRYFYEQLQSLISRAVRYDSDLSLIIADIDFFKKFNDTYGHQSGDAVLKQVASELKRSVRSADIVCRYGGEELSIILPETGYEEAVMIANKLCNAVGTRVYKLANGRESNVTVSIGVAAYGVDGDTPAKLIETADKRLYNAKENGRNRVN